MSNRRLPTLALLAGVVCAVAPPCLADLRASLFGPPAPVNLDVPPQVGAAIVGLREACAAWRPITLTARPPTASPLAASPLAASPLAASPLAATPLDAGPVAVSPAAASPLDAGPVAVSPAAASPLEAGPVATPLAVSPLALSRVPRPVERPYASAARTICDVAANPTEAFWPSMFFAGLAGAALFFFGLVFFSLLHGLLVSAWNWRLSIGEKSW